MPGAFELGSEAASDGALVCVLGVGSVVSEIRFFRLAFARAVTLWSSSIISVSCDKKDAAVSKSSASALACFDFLASDRALARRLSSSSKVFRSFARPKFSADLAWTFPSATSQIRVDFVDFLGHVD